MNKIIIENRTDEPDEDILRRVLVVMHEGRVSETAGRTHFCHLTTWTDGVCISASINAKSDRFVAWKRSETE